MKTQEIFNELIDMYPEFLRVGILNILRYIKTKQELGVCLPIYIYTNNQCDDINWIYKLIEYFESVLFARQLFARPIFAFKIKGKRIERGRTSHEKTYSDFVRCSMLSTSHNICFIDDAYYKKMKNHRIYYIQPLPYIHPLSKSNVIDRFLHSLLYLKLKKMCPFWENKLDEESESCSMQVISGNIASMPHKNAFSLELEKQIANKMMYYIREFFLLSSKKCSTKKSREKMRGFTRKKYRN